MREWTRVEISRFFVYFFLTLGALIMLLPFFWMFSSAFKTTQEINRFPPQWLPSHLSLDNFKRAFEMAPFARYFVNSVIVMVCSVSVTTFTTILAAFAFSRLRFPGRNLIFSLLLSLMMIPFEMLIARQLYDGRQFEDLRHAVCADPSVYQLDFLHLYSEEFL